MMNHYYHSMPTIINHSFSASHEFSWKWLDLLDSWLPSLGAPCCRLCIHGEGEFTLYGERERRHINAVGFMTMVTG